MFAPLLSTKLYIPRRQPLAQRTNFVPRPHLLKKLEAGLTSKLTLIAAPAGFGKSTLLSDWISETESPPSALASGKATKIVHRPTFSWLSLDESDNDPIRFWLYVIAALQSINLGFSADIPALLQSPEPPPLETILTLLLNDLSAKPQGVTPEIVLVLEDYHVIVMPAIHQSLTFLLDHMPPTLHLVMTTRADPPLPLARLRARGQLSEIRADDLRFTVEETTLFLNDRMGLHLSPDEVHLLAARTEGWIVGLHLAAISMQGHEDQTGFLRSFSGGHRYILNYLIEEVLNQQPKAVQEFLLRTSILARICGPLCDAVIGVGEWGSRGIEARMESPHPLTLPSPHPLLSGQAMLEQLDQANLFLVRLDDQAQWYRYHQLFAEVLQHRLRQSQPEILPTLHQRASTWYGRHGYLADAVQHALLAADFARAAELIEQVWPLLWNQGAIATLFNWMQALPGDNIPGDALWGRPSLYVSYAWGLALAGQIEAAEACLRQVEATLQPLWTEAAGVSPTHTLLLGRATALRAMLTARRGEPLDAARLAQQALTLIPIGVAARGDAYYALGLAKQQQGALDEAFQAYEAANQSGMAAHDSFLTIAAPYHEARILMAQGYLRQAATTYQQVLKVAAQSRKQLPVVGLVHVGYGEILYQWNDLVAATRQVDTGLALSPRRDLTYTDGPLHRFSILARIRQSVGDREGALAAIGLAKETAQQTGIALDAERAAALEALIHLRLGEVALAKPWAERYTLSRTGEERFSYLHEFETLVFVRILLANGRVDEVLALLAHWVSIREAAQHRASVIELYMLQTLALHLDGQVDRAMETLARTLTLAEPEGYIRLFVDEGEPMRFLILDFRSFQGKLWIAKQGYTGEQTNLLTYVDKLLQAFDQPQSTENDWQGAVQSGVLTGSQNPKLVVEGSKIQNLIEPLTDREIEVLRLVTEGLSNAAIAQQLVVSVGTVKTHLKHIYGKLAVQSRTQAVAQARVLDLL